MIIFNNAILFLNANKLLFYTWPTRQIFIMHQVYFHNVSGILQRILENGQAVRHLGL